MPLTAPNLDSRTFDDLVAEAKARIPRYTPEWTDFNESDPGMALVQLQAWLTETILDQLNQVPDLYYIKFLQLLGIERRQATPARAELTFALKKPVTGTVIVPKGTRVGVADSDLEKPPVFETARSLTAIAGQIKEVISVPVLPEGTPDVPLSRTTASNTPGTTFYAFREATAGPARPGDALYLGFKIAGATFPTEEVGLLIYLRDPALALAAGAAPTADDDTPTQSCTIGERPAAPLGRSLAWEYYQGPIAQGRAEQWAPLDLFADETAGLTTSGYVYLRGPSGFPQANPPEVVPVIQKENNQTPNLFWFRLRIDDIELGARPPRIDTIQINTVSASAALTVLDEIVGSSNGRPGQTFTLRNRPLLADPPLRLEVDEGQGAQAWTEVSDFYRSGAGDDHFVLNRNSGVITFGDGRHGRVPIAGIDNIIARSYRYGGGLAGNAGSKKITALQSSIAEVESVTNFRAAFNGADEEVEADARLRAPHEIRTRDRAVTADDFRFLAEQTPGANIARAEALPLVDPYQAGKEVKGAVTVMVVPQSDSPRPQPDAATLGLVCAYLDARRLVTTELYVRGPQYHDFELQVEAIARSDADLRTVKKALTATITTYLHPLGGGEDGKGWPFGGTLYYSELLRAALATAGVQRMADITIVKDGNRQPSCEDVAVSPGYLIYLSKLTVMVRYQR